MFDDLYTTDTPEERRRCLICSRPDCDNCLEHKRFKEDTKYDDLKRLFMPLYYQQYTDKDIAKQLGTNTNKIRSLRICLGLQANRFRTSNKKAAPVLGTLKAAKEI